MAPASGAVTYEVAIAVACQVIGPLSPGMWKVTARVRPARSAPAGSCTKGRLTGSDHACAPGATVTLRLPAKVIGRLVPGTTAAPVICSPANAVSNVTGWEPKALEKRNRICRPHRSGLMMSRKLCSCEPASGCGKAKDRSGCALAKPTG